MIDEQPIQLKEKPDYLAPDSSEIYLLVDGTNGGMCQCVLHVGEIADATRNMTVEELWFILEGEGEIWRENLCDNEPVKIFSGLSIVIPSQIAYQFKNTGSVPLKILITTMPPWPGRFESQLVKGIW